MVLSAEGGSVNGDPSLQNRARYATVPWLPMTATVAPTYQGRPVDPATSAFGSLQVTDASGGDFAMWRRLGRGSPDPLTARTPIGDCPVEKGGLTILEGSHRQQPVLDYTELDVDEYCRNGLDATAIERGDQRWDQRANNGVFEVDAIAVRERLGGRWVTSDFRAGDLLVFTMQTLHASRDNQTEGFRLSSGSRYQLSAEPSTNDGWVSGRPAMALAAKRR